MLTVGEDPSFMHGAPWPAVDWVMQPDESPPYQQIGWSWEAQQNSQAFMHGAPWPAVDWVMQPAESPPYQQIGWSWEAHIFPTSRSTAQGQLVRMSPLNKG